MPVIATGEDVAPEIVGYVDRFEAYRQNLVGCEIGWLRDHREAAMAEFARLGFPTPRDEAWRYTNVGPVMRRRFDQCPERPAEPLRENLAQAVDAAARELRDSHRLVFVNGSFYPALSSLSGPGAIGVAQSLSAGLATASDTLEPYLNSRGATYRNGFTALNAAFMTDGAYVRIPAHTTLEIPLHLVFITTGAEQGYASYPRNLIISEPGSSAVVVESYVSADSSAHLTNSSTHVWLDERARLEHYQIQQENDQSYWFSSMKVALGEGASYAAHAVGLGARLGRCDIDVSLDAPGGNCTLNGLYVASGRRHLDYHTTVEHRAPDCTSAELYKGILDGHGRAVFNGRVVVSPGAQGTNASQANHNLLLSRDAEIDTKPELEIYADDVKCSHGATVGQLDTAMLFYLRSRGIDELQARAMLTFAFTQEVLDRMSLPGIRELAQRALARVLPAAALGNGGAELLLEVNHDH